MASLRDVGDYIRGRPTPRDSGVITAHALRQPPFHSSRNTHQDQPLVSEEDQTSDEDDDDNVEIHTRPNHDDIVAAPASIAHDRL